MEISADNYDTYLPKKKQKFHSETYRIITAYVPTLQQIAAVKISTPLLFHSDLRYFYFYHCQCCSSALDSTCCDCLELILSKLIDKLNCLSLPEQWKQILLNVCRPMGKQILTRIVSDVFYFSRSIFERMDCIRWSDEGIFDEVETVKALFISVKFKYVFGYMFNACCEQCIEKNIFMLWEKIPEESKDRFHYDSYFYHFTAYWTCVLRNELPDFLPKVIQADPHSIYNIEHSIYKNMVTLSVHENNVVALKYFWNKITTEEVNSFIHEWIHRASGKDFVPKQSYDFECISEASNVFIFLLSQLTAKDQTEYICKYTTSVLWASFYDWPWQRHFLPVFEAVVDVLEEDEYAELIKTLLSRGSSVKPMLFSVLSMSTPRLKENFISDVCRKWNGGCVLFDLLKDHDSETVRWILSLADIRDLENTFSRSFVENRDEKITSLVLSDQVPLLDLLISESRLSEAFVCNLKFEIVKSCVNHVCLKWISNGKFEAADNFLRWGCSSQDVVDNFKETILDRLYIVRSLIQKGSFYLLEKFLMWCCTCDENLSAFKKQILSESHVLFILCCLSKASTSEWHLFERFLCFFNSDLDIDNLKRVVSENEQLNITICSMLVSHQFEFSKELLHWCFISDEGIAQYKRTFLVSHLGFTLFTTFSFIVATNNTFDSWEELKMLAKWFHPIPKNTIDEFKNILIRGRWLFMTEVQKRERMDALFWLLDNVLLDTSGGGVDGSDDLYRR